jgi:hypothetical protein
VKIYALKIGQFNRHCYNIYSKKYVSLIQLQNGRRLLTIVILTRYNTSDLMGKGFVLTLFHFSFFFVFINKITPQKKNHKTIKTTFILMSHLLGHGSTTFEPNGHWPD